MRPSPNPYLAALEDMDLAAELALRDGALLALASAGLTAPEISRLRATAVRYVASRDEQPQVGVQWHTGPGARYSTVKLSTVEGARVLAYLEAEEAWQSPRPLFLGRAGRPLSYQWIHQILRGYAVPIEREWEALGVVELVAGRGR